MPTRKRDSRLSSMFLPGAFLGEALQSNDMLVGREDVVFGGARLLRRLPEAEHKDPEFLLKVRGPSVGEADPHVAANLDLVAPLEQLPPHPVALVQKPRRVKIRKNVDLAR